MLSVDYLRHVIPPRREEIAARTTSTIHGLQPLTKINLNKKSFRVFQRVQMHCAKSRSKSESFEQELYNDKTFLAAFYAFQSTFVPLNQSKAECLTKFLLKRFGSP